MSTAPPQLLSSLRQSVNERFPGGLTPALDARLQQTLAHFTKEVNRVRGPSTNNSQEILRESFSSLTKWFREQQARVLPSPSQPSLPQSFAQQPSLPQSFAQQQTLNPVQAYLQLQQQSQQSLPQSFAQQQSRPPPPPRPCEGEDPLTVFKRLQAEREAASAKDPAPSPTGVTELEPLPPPPSRAETTAVQPKDFITRKPDEDKQREVEYNLVINSQDRNWLADSDQQNRYRFKVQFNAQDQVNTTNPSILNRLRNIVRIEFVKAILPVEGLDVIVPRDCSDGYDTAPDKAFTSVLALPYVSVVMDEHTGNIVGTNDTLDRAFAVCQYDATWRPDMSLFRANANRGYTLFFPKLMKAQRVFEPTPLANLQTMSFRINNPENGLLSTLPDSARLALVAFGSHIDASGSCYADASGEYLFLQTQSWFPMWSFSQMDRIRVGGYKVVSSTSPVGATAFTNWLQQTSGHAIVGIANSITGGVDDGPNACGYANWIIIRNRFVDPTTGACSLAYFTGPTDTNEAAFAADVAAYPSALQTGAVLNLSRQVQLTLRVVTTDYDTASKVRTDLV